MAIIKRVLFLIAFFTLFISCSMDDQSGDSGVDVIKISYFEEIKSAEWFEAKKYIPLNARNASDYLYKIGKIKFSGEYIYILQLEGNGRTVFKFSTDGRMIRSINGLTSIEKKFYGVTDMVMTDRGFVLNDRSQRELIYFDEDLNFVKSDPVPLDNGLQNIYFLNSEDLVVRPVTSDGMVESSLYTGKSTDLSSLSMIDGFLGVVGGAGAKIPAMSFDNFFPSSNKNSTLYVDYFENTIREVSDRGVFEKYQIILNDNIWVSENDKDKMETMDGDELFSFLNKSDKGIKFDHVYEDGEKLILSFMRIKKRYYIVKNKLTGKVKSGFINFEKSEGYLQYGSPALKYLQGFTNDGKLVFYLNAEEFKLFAKDLGGQISQSDKETDRHDKIIDAAREIDEYCSTVIVYADLK